MAPSIDNGPMHDRASIAAFAGLASLAVAMGIGRFAFTPLMPMMQCDAALTVAEGGWLASANYVGYLVGGLSAVALRLAPSLAIRAGLAAVGVATLAMGLSANMAAWLALRAVAGVASAWVLVFASAWCLERLQVPSRSRQAVLSATVFSGVGIGIALTGVACIVLAIAQTTSAFAWIVLGVLALLGTLAAWSVFAPVAGTPARRETPRLAWNADTLRLVACYGAFGFGYIIPATFLSSMAREAASDPAIYGWSWPAFGLAAAGSTFAAALLRRRCFTDRGLWIAGHLAMAAGVVAPLAWRGLGGIVASALLVGGTFMAVTMVGMQEARRVAGADSRPLIAAMTAAFAAGQVAGPLAVSALAARGAGFAPALWIAAAVLVASAVALVPFRQSRRSP